MYNGGDDAEGANTKYNLTGSEEYTIEPSGEGSVDAVGLMTTDAPGSGSEVSLISVTFELKEGSGSQITHGENIIDNGDFSNQDFSSWSASLGDATITAEPVENGANIGVTTCGAITRSGDPSKSYECFAQDITGKVREGEEYEFSFGQNCRMIIRILKIKIERFSENCSISAVLCEWK